MQQPSSVTDVPFRFPWIAPVIGLTLAGLGFFTIFQAALNYLVDTFQRYAASAIAANSKSSCRTARVHGQD